MKACKHRRECMHFEESESMCITPVTFMGHTVDFWLELKRTVDEHGNGMEDMINRNIALGDQLYEVSAKAQAYDNMVAMVKKYGEKHNG
jgi:hypothetical protein